MYCGFQMRQEAQRHIERENQADSKRIRLRFHTHENLRQKAFGASNSIKVIFLHLYYCRNLISVNRA